MSMIAAEFYLRFDFENYYEMDMFLLFKETIFCSRLLEPSKRGVTAYV